MWASLSSNRCVLEVVLMSEAKVIYCNKLFLILFVGICTTGVPRVFKGNWVLLPSEKVCIAGVRHQENMPYTTCWYILLQHNDIRDLCFCAAVVFWASVVTAPSCFPEMCEDFKLHCHDKQLNCHCPWMYLWWNVQNCRIGVNNWVKVNVKCYTVHHSQF